MEVGTGCCSISLAMWAWCRSGERVESLCIRAKMVWSLGRAGHQGPTDSEPLLKTGSGTVRVAGCDPGGLVPAQSAESLDGESLVEAGASVGGNDAAHQLGVADRGGEGDPGAEGCTQQDGGIDAQGGSARRGRRPSAPSSLVG